LSLEENQTPSVMWIFTETLLLKKVKRPWHEIICSHKLIWTTRICVLVSAGMSVSEPFQGIISVVTVTIYVCVCVFWLKTIALPYVFIAKRSSLQVSEWRKDIDWLLPKNGGSHSHSNWFLRKFCKEPFGFISSGGSNTENGRMVIIFLRHFYSLFFTNGARVQPRMNPECAVSVNNVVISRKVQWYSLQKTRFW